MKYTIFIRQADGCGTTFITSCEAECVAQAKRLALDECADSWGEEYTPEDLIVLGVAAGDVSIIEWDDDGLELGLVELRMPGRIP